MIKRFLLGSVASAALLTTVWGAETPNAAPAAPAAPALNIPTPTLPPQITIDQMIAGWPENVAEYDGKMFTLKDLADDLRSQFTDGKLPPGVTAEAARQFAPDLVTGMVTQRLLFAAMEKAGIKPSEAATAEVLKKQIKEAGEQELAFFSQILGQQNMTIDQYIAKQAKDPEMQKVVAMEEFMEKHVTAGVKVTEADARKYYDENKEQFTQPADPEGSMRASHILIMIAPDASEADKTAAKAKINGILEQVKADPAKFADLAKANSDCPSKAQGGSLGVFMAEQMVQPFSQAAAALKAGEISDVVETQYGYHIIRRDASVTAAELIPFDQVKAQLIEYLTGMKKQEAVQAFVDKMLKDAKFKLLIEAPAAAENN